MAVTNYELLAPAGDEVCLKAAVENGADAVYFGLHHGFNARARATNFDLAALPDVFTYLHRRGVRGYVTLNTLAFTNELADLERTLRELIRAGVDAILVQDLGFARLTRELCPELPIHASTQMTLTSAECLAAVQTFGIERVVLPRELSLDEIRKIHAESSVPLEAFVHGALCVAYSGQCLTSESLGGRSANRGQCAQACRLPYDLICDGNDVDLGPQKYLLSPQDLAAYALIPDLMAAGVTSFKIEGRLKTPEYVANITRHYRQAIDAAIAEQPLKFTADDVREMELSFSRGFSPGWLQGCDHKRLVPGLNSAKRGVLLGYVQTVHPQSVEIELVGPLSAGDGVVFEGNREANDEQGGRVYSVRKRGRFQTEPMSSGIAELTFAENSIDFERLVPNQAVWKTDDPKLTAKLRKTFIGPDPIRKLPIDFHITAITGQHLVIEAVTAAGQTVRLTSPEELPKARTRPMTREFLREQFSRLGHTSYELRSLDAQIEGEPMLPLSVLSDLRRSMITELDVRTAIVPERSIQPTSVLETLRQSIPLTSSPRSPTSSPQLWLLCRTREQLQAALSLEIAGIYADFPDPRDYRDAVQSARSSGVPLYLTTPRIQKPGEIGLFHQLRKYEPDGLLVRNLSGLQFCREHGLRCVADYSLNVTNELTAQWVMEFGPSRVTASYDLNREQLLDLISVTPPAWLEIVVHQHMPLFHMEHCVFCAVLSPGTNKTNCGRPCDDHVVHLRDRVGMKHPLHADVGCRNTLFNAMAQSAAEVVPTLLEHGLQTFRVEMLAESPEELRHTVRLYRELMIGQRSATDVWRELRAANRVGVTRGTLEERRNPLAIL